MNRQYHHSGEYSGTRDKYELLQSVDKKVREFFKTYQEQFASYPLDRGEV